MAFVVPHAPLTPRHKLAVDLDASAVVVRARDLAAYRNAEQAVAAAQAQAAEIVANSQAAFEAERQRGYAEGTERAQREGAQRIGESVARTDRYFADSEKRLVELVMAAV